MTRFKALLAAGAALLLAAGVLPRRLGADEATVHAHYDILALSDGRTLHNVKVISDQPDSIVVKADEGLIKVAKALLPGAVTNAYPASKVQAATGTSMIMKPFDPNQHVDGPGPDPGTKAAPKPTPKPAPAAPGTFKGCSILGFQMKAYRDALGCALVTVRNDSEAAAEIRPWDIVAVTADGTRLPGRSMIIEGDTVVIKRTEVVPAHGDVTDLVTFTNAAAEIATVQWAH